MTCSHADEDCPLINGSSARIASTYDDPKDLDNTPEGSAKYAERVHQIGREILYVFSMVSKKNKRPYEFNGCCHLAENTK